MDDNSMRSLLVRIDERQQTLLEQFKEHKELTEAEIREIKKTVKHNSEIIRDAKTGARVIVWLASIGSVVAIQWEAIKNMVLWIVGKDT